MISLNLVSTHNSILYLYLFIYLYIFIFVYLYLYLLIYIYIYLISKKKKKKNIYLLIHKYILFIYLDQKKQKSTLLISKEIQNYSNKIQIPLSKGYKIYKKIIKLIFTIIDKILLYKNQRCYTSFNIFIEYLHNYY